MTALLVFLFGEPVWPDDDHEHRNALSMTEQLALCWLLIVHLLETDFLFFRQTLFVAVNSDEPHIAHSTVTLLAKLRGLSTSVPRAHAV